MNLKDIEEYQDKKTKNTNLQRLYLLGAFLSLCTILFLSFDLLQEFGVVEIAEATKTATKEIVFSTKDDMIIKGLMALGIIIVLPFVYKQFKAD